MQASWPKPARSRCRRVSGCFDGGRGDDLLRVVIMAAMVPQRTEGSDAEQVTVSTTASTRHCCGHATHRDDAAGPSTRVPFCRYQTYR